MIGLSLGILLSLLGFHFRPKEEITRAPEKAQRTPFFVKEKPKRKPLVRDELEAWKQENDRVN